MTIDSFDIAEDGVHIVLQAEGRQIALNYPHGEQTQALVGVPVEVYDPTDAAILCGLCAAVLALWSVFAWCSREWWTSEAKYQERLAREWKESAMVAERNLAHLRNQVGRSARLLLEDIGETVEEE